MLAARAEVLPGTSSPLEAEGLRTVPGLGACAQVLKHNAESIFTSLAVRTYGYVFTLLASSLTKILASECAYRLLVVGSICESCETRFVVRR